MPKQNSEAAVVHLRGADLEIWRLENALTKAEAADAFGLRRGAWEEFAGPEQSQNVISDPAVAMLLCLYRTHPEASPVSAPPSVAEFYEFLGLQDSPRDRERFAILIGRSKPSVYRLLADNGTPGRPVVRWIEAIRRLHLSSRQSRLLMSDVVSKVGEQQGVADVLTRGWSRVDGRETESE